MSGRDRAAVEDERRRAERDIRREIAAEDPDIDFDDVRARVDPREEEADIRLRSEARERLTRRDFAEATADELDAFKTLDPDEHVRIQDGRPELVEDVVVEEEAHRERQMREEFAREVSEQLEYESVDPDEDIVRTDEGSLEVRERILDREAEAHQETQRAQVAEQIDDEIGFFDVEPDHIRLDDGEFGLDPDVQDDIEAAAEAEREAAMREAAAEQIDPQFPAIDVRPSHVDITDEGQIQLGRHLRRRRQMLRRRGREQIAEDAAAEIEADHGFDVDPGDINVLLHREEIQLPDDLEHRIATRRFDEDLDIDVDIGDVEAVDDGWELREDFQRERIAEDLEAELRDEGFDVDVDPDALEEQTTFQFDPQQRDIVETEQFELDHASRAQIAAQELDEQLPDVDVGRWDVRLTDEGWQLHDDVVEEVEPDVEGPIDVRRAIEGEIPDRHLPDTPGIPAEADLRHQVAADLGIDPSDVDVETEIEEIRGDPRTDLTDTRLQQRLDADVDEDVEEGLVADALDIDRDELEVDDVTGEFVVEPEQERIFEEDTRLGRLEDWIAPDSPVEFRRDTRPEQVVELIEARTMQEIDRGEEIYGDLGPVSTPATGVAELGLQRVFPDTSPETRGLVRGVGSVATDRALEDVSPRVADRVGPMIGAGAPFVDAIAERVDDSADRVGLDVEFGRFDDDLDDLSEGLEGRLDQDDIDVDTIGTEADRFMAAAPAEAARWAEPAGIVLLGTGVGRHARDDLQAEFDTQVDAGRRIWDDPTDADLDDVRDLAGRGATPFPVSPAFAERRVDDISTAGEFTVDATGDIGRLAVEDPVRTPARAVGGLASLALPLGGARAARRLRPTRDPPDTISRFEITDDIPRDAISDPTPTRRERIRELVDEFEIDPRMGAGLVPPRVQRRRRDRPSPDPGRPTRDFEIDTLRMLDEDIGRALEPDIRAPRAGRDPSVAAPIGGMMVGDRATDLFEGQQLAERAGDLEIAQHEILDPGLRDAVSDTAIRQDRITAGPRERARVAEQVMTADAEMRDFAGPQRGILDVQATRQPTAQQVRTDQRARTARQTRARTTARIRDPGRPRIPMGLPEFPGGDGPDEWFSPEFDQADFFNPIDVGFGVLGPGAPAQQSEGSSDALYPELSPEDDY